MTGAPMPSLVVDVGRLRKRVLLGHQLTGIDRVTVEYLRWCLDAGGRACLKLGKRLAVLPESQATVLLRRAESQWRDDPGRGQRASSALGDLPLAVQGLVGRGRVGDALLLNTSQSWLQEGALWDHVEDQRVRVVAFIHDLIPITHPEYNRSHASSLHVARLDETLQRSAGIVVNSQHTLDCLAEHATDVGLTLPPATVLHLGNRVAGQADSRPASERPFFVALGTIEPRKNHILLLQVWKRLLEEGFEPMPRLLFVGKLGWNSEHVERFMAQCDAIRPHVEHVTPACNQTVANLVRHANALLFPSFAEGYGLPLVEALSLGTPVIASPLPPFLEVAGSFPEYADPLDGLRWKELVCAYTLQDADERRLRRAKLEAFHPPTWDDHFAGLQRFLSQLA